MEWVPPDAAPTPVPAQTSVSPSTPERSGAGDVPSAPSAASRPGLPRLGPMTVSDVLDGSFSILKAAPATIIAFTAIFSVPVQVLGAWMQRDLLGGASLIDMFNQGDSSLTSIDQGGSGTTWAQIVLLFGPALALVFVASGLVRLVAAWHVGRDLTLRELLRGTAPMAAPLLGSWLLVHVAEGLGLLLCGLPALAAMTLFLVTAPVIGAEGLGAVAAMRRSARLVRRRFWPVMGLSILSSIVAMLFGYALGLVPTTLSLVVGTAGYGWLLTAASGILTSLITTPIVAGITVLIYLDLRVRTEGLDLELDAAAAFPAS